MRRKIDWVYDHVAGYFVLCCICRRLVLARPPRLTWLMEGLETGSDELEAYLSALGVGNDDTTGEGKAEKPRRFSEVVRFDRTRNGKSKWKGKP